MNQLHSNKINFLSNHLHSLYSHEISRQSLYVLSFDINWVSLCLITEIYLFIYLFINFFFPIEILYFYEKNVTRKLNGEEDI